jgi:hypothetical protein
VSPSGTPNGLHDITGGKPESLGLRERVAERFRAPLTRPFQSRSGRDLSRNLASPLGDNPCWGRQLCPVNTSAEIHFLDCSIRGRNMGIIRTLDCV